jgi:hypothetical protein
MPITSHSASCLLGTGFLTTMMQNDALAILASFLVKLMALLLILQQGPVSMVGQQGCRAA